MLMKEKEGGGGGDDLTPVTSINAGLIGQSQ